MRAGWLVAFFLVLHDGDLLGQRHGLFIGFNGSGVRLVEIS
jgi:hypothetical protein